MNTTAKPAPITANSVISGLVALPWGATLFGTAPALGGRNRR
jgi:hypothetical protein